MRDRGLELLKRVLGGDANFRKGQWRTAFTRVAMP